MRRKKEQNYNTYRLSGVLVNLGYMYEHVLDIVCV